MATKRKIIFKAKSKESNEWITGSLIQNGNGCFIKNPFTNKTTEVSGDIIYRYTDAVDDRARIICEGDIILMKHPPFKNKLFIVKWSDRYMGFVFCEPQFVENEHGSYCVDNYRRFTAEQINDKVTIVCSICELINDGFPLEEKLKELMIETQKKSDKEN